MKKSIVSKTFCTVQYFVYDTDLWVLKQIASDKTVKVNEFIRLNELLQKFCKYKTIDSTF